MDRYNLYCTPSQTKKALELGAPIKKERIGKCITENIPRLTNNDEENEYDYILPTVEQMCGWLKTKGISLTGTTVYLSRDYDSLNRRILVVIDSALRYLTNKK